MRQLLFILSLLYSTILYAQKTTVKGVVTSQTGEALVGVSIKEKGTNKETTTDAKGGYAITTSSADAVLIYSYIGYTPIEIKAGDNATRSVQLLEETKSMDEVVVIGYGSVQRKDLTGSVASVSGEELNKVPVPDVTMALAGRLAGVQVSASEGAPGSEMSIKVRGGGSITQSNEPLYVIDGVPQTEGINFLDPTDIESIDVLKDAASTAIYGSRGANGVILVTTKKNKAGRTNVTYDTYMGGKSINNTLPVLKPYDYTVLQYERSLADESRLARFEQTYGTFDQLEELYMNRPGINWQEQVFGGTANSQYHKIGVNGGNQATRYSLFYSMNNDEGIMLNSGAKKHVAKLSLNHQANERLSLNGSVNYSEQKVYGLGTNEGNTYLNQLQNILTYRPLYGLAGTDEDFLNMEEDPALEDVQGNTLQNPLVNAESQHRDILGRFLYLNTDVQYKLTDHITYRGLVNYRNISTKTDLFYDRRSMMAKRNNGPQGSMADQVRSGWSYSNTLMYENTFNQDHKFDVLLGQEQNYLLTKYNRVTATGFPDETLGLDNLYEASTFIGESNNQDERMISFFARANYNYKSKYLVSASLRSDGSSKFGPNNKFGYFPAASFAWRIIEEDFMKNQGVLSDLKLRFSIGTSGNNRIANYTSLALLSTGTYPLNDRINVTVFPNTLPNPDLKWEATRAENLGLDMAFFNQRIQLTAELYRNTTKDLLLQAEVPMSSGYSTMLINAGSTQNSGVELSMNTTNINTPNFKWTTDFNWAFNRNKVLALTDGESFRNVFSDWGVLTESDYIIQVGQALGQMYGYKTEGLYQVDDFNFDSNTQTYMLKDGIPYDNNNIPQPGFLKFVDTDGNGTINPDDRAVIGNAIPKGMGGLNNTFSYKGIDLSIFLNWAYGNDVYNANKLYSSQTQLDYRSTLSYFADRWMSIDASGNRVTDPAALAAMNEGKTVPVYNSNTALRFYDYVVENGSFLRINNISIGYTIPKSFLSRFKINGLRVYATAYNLGTIAGYSGYDPEVSSRNSTGLTPGIDFGAYPRAKSFVAGINLSL